MHLPEGQIKSYLDQELAPTEKERVEAHLATCPSCQQRANKLAAVGSGVSQHLSALTASQAQAPSLGSARVRLQNRIAEKEKITMRHKIFNAKYRPIWVALALVLVLGVALLFPPVQAIANSFLGLFRVQQFTVVQVNPGELPEQLGSSSQLETMFTNNVHIQEQGEAQDAATPEEASQLAGLPVRLPVGMKDEPILKVMPGADITFDIDLQNWLEQNFNAVVILDLLSSFFRQEPIDTTNLDTMLVSLARRGLEATMGRLRVPASRLTERFLRDYTDFGADCVIFPAPVGCKHVWGWLSMLREVCREEGIPICAFDLDWIDSRVRPTESVRAGIEEFFTTVMAQ